MTEADETMDRTPRVAPEAAASELVRILDGYLDALQAGRHPDRARLMAEHPDLAEELKRCLSGVEFIHRAAGPPSTEPAQLGEFRIVREIGRGGMGVVYEAEQTTLGRRVALKVLRYGAVADAEAMERFRREAETVARLHHTNIVPIFAVGTERDVHFYAMQYIEGRSLAAVADEAREAGRPLDPAALARWGLQAADALGHAHRRGVIHRDVKPSNLLIDPEGTLWLTDFGLARRLDEATMTVSGALMGTPRYMSPEQAEALRRPVDHRTDVYSLGATLYELATGRPVFEAATPHAVIARILADEPTAPRQLRRSLPRDLETIVMTCLAKDPARRYATAQALADDLRAVLEGRSIRARRASPAERAVRWGRRNRRLAAVAAASAALAALLLGAAIAGREGYRRARLGSFALTTGEPHLSAELLDDRGEEVVLPRFSLPTLEPVELPAGSYHARIMAPGLPSETYRLIVEPGGGRSYKVGLDHRRLWAPIPYQCYQRAVEVVERSGRADLLEWSSRSTLRLLDGRTATPAWSLDLSGASRPDPATGAVTTVLTPPAGPEAAAEEMRRRGLLQQLPEGVTGRLRVVSPAPDLDGDGDPDVVLTCRGGDAQWWALSGRGDGRGRIKELWTYRAEQGPGKGPVEAVGNPATFDADGDGTPDLIATLRSGTDHRVEAISGRSGRTLWRRDLEGRWFARPAFTRFDFLAPAALATVAGRPRVVLVTPTRLVTIDPKTGAIEAARPPGAYPGHPPVYADLDGDGSTDILLAGTDAQGRGLIEAASLDPPRTLWSVLTAVTLTVPGAREQANWPLAADLDGDGAAEVALPIAANPGQRAWTGVEVRRGSDGAMVWSRRLRWPTFPLTGPPNQIAVGPDVDGDGRRELFAASPGSAAPSSAGLEDVLLVDALSGRDGRSLWWWKRRLPQQNATVAPLRWWGSGPDGWPQLLVPVQSYGARPLEVDVLSAASGRLLQAIPDGTEPHEADFDGDGVADLALRLVGDPGGFGGSLHALRGMPPSPWARLGSWTLTGDLDRDGLADLVEIGPDGPTAASGRDGRILWRSAAWDRGPGTEPEWQVLPDGTPSGRTRVPASSGVPDLDGDGTPDLLLTRRFWSARAGPAAVAVPLRAVSGRTGARLWDAEDLEAPGPVRVFSSVKATFSKDLDGDGRPEVVATLLLEAGGPPPTHQLRLAVFSGRDGRLRWQRPIGDDPRPSGSSFLASVRPRPVTADLDSDGVLDLVFTVPVLAAGADMGIEVVALGGRDGRPLWRTPVGTRPGRLFWTEGALPEPVAGDLDGDGKPEVVVADWVARQAGEGGTGATAEKMLEVRALGGRDGHPLWPAWRGPDCPGCGTDAMPDDAPPPPTLLAPGPGGSRGIVVALHDIRRSRCVVLDARGRVAREWEPPGSPGAVRRVRHPLIAADLDGDGRQELVLLVDASPDSRVIALGPDLRAPRWDAAVPQHSRLLGVQRSAGGRGLEVVVGALGSRAFALEGTTGRRLWRGWGLTGEPAMIVGNSPLFNSAVLPGAAVGELPRVVGRRGDATVCLATLPTATPGGYTAPWRGAPSLSDAADLRDVKPLPWEAVGPGALVAMAAMGTLALVVFVAPVAAVARVVREGRPSLGGLLLLPAVAAGVLAFGSRIDPLLAGLSPAPIAYPIAPELVPRALRGGLMVATRAAYGLPVAALLVTSAVWVRRGRWRSLGLMAAVSATLSAICTALLVRNDLAPGQRYSMSGWAWILLPGAYGAGLAILASLLLRPVTRLVRRAVSRPGRRAGAPGGSGASPAAP